MAEPSAAGEEPGLVIFDKTIPAEDRIDLQSSTPRFIGFLVLAIGTFVLLLVLLWPVLDHYVAFAKATGFPNPWAFFFGNLIAAVLLAYACYTTSVYSRNLGVATAVFWAFFFFLVSMIGWTVNLRVRIGDFGAGIDTHSERGDFYIFLAVIFSVVLMILAFSFRFKTGLAMLLVVVWVMMLLYFWLFV